jgi:hypothetical protein
LKTIDPAAELRDFLFSAKTGNANGGLALLRTKEFIFFLTGHFFYPTVCAPVCYSLILPHQF